MPPCVNTGIHTASASKVANRLSAIDRGGCVSAFGTRCTCTHIISRKISDTPM